MMTVAAVAAAVSLALPYYESILQPNLFGSAGGSSVLGQVLPDWPLGVPLGFIVVALAIAGVLLGALAIARRGGRGIGATAMVVWLALGGAAAGWWQSLADGDVAPGSGAIVAGAAVVVGLVGAIVVTATRPGGTTKAW